MGLVGHFNVFEGDNGVGKTSVIDVITRRTFSTLIKTPGDEYDSIRDYVHQNNSVFGIFLYYVSSVFNASVNIGKTIEEGSNVICDRYITSSFVDFLIRGDLEFDNYLDLYNLVKQELVMPKNTFLLRCSHDERIRRVLKRNMGVIGRDDISEDYSKKADQIYDRFVEIEPNWHIIDTTTMAVEDIVDEVLLVMRK